MCIALVLRLEHATGGVRVGIVYNNNNKTKTYIAA